MDREALSQHILAYQASVRHEDWIAMTVKQLRKGLEARVGRSLKSEKDASCAIITDMNDAENAPLPEEDEDAPETAGDMGDFAAAIGSRDDY